MAQKLQKQKSCSFVGNYVKQIMYQLPSADEAVPSHINNAENVPREECVVEKNASKFLQLLR